MEEEKTNKNQAHTKTFICIAAPGNKGKTGTALEVIKLLKKYKATVTVLYEYITPPNKLVYSVIKINGQVIGVDTEGDPNTLFPQRIDTMLNKYPCNAVVCTSRTRGETLDGAHRAAKKYQMVFIQTTTYQPDNHALYNDMNELKAEQLIALLKKRNHLP